MTKRIIGSMVVKNELDRYLVSCIKHAQTFLDEIFVYDDRSSDETAEVAIDLGCRVVRRPDSRPSFINHEGKFRYSAWRAFEQVMKPAVGDWIFSFDADEFMVNDGNASISKTLDVATDRAEKNNFVGIILPFPEIFKIEDGEFYYRVDGQWANIRGPRLFRYQTNAEWALKPMGCGSEPTYVSKAKNSTQNYGLTVLHLGYARDEDKQAKYNRYSSLAQHGHNDKHIESIIKIPTLKKWEGSKPEVTI
jgi:glycosyltransferase involved in cell wall biosynthesis